MKPAHTSCTALYLPSYLILSQLFTSLLVEFQVSIVFSLCHILKTTLPIVFFLFFSFLFFVFLSSLSSDPPYPILPLHIPSILKLIKPLI